MNDRCFACTDCKTYVNAGGRWCMHTLESHGVVRLGQPVDVAGVLADPNYWDEKDEPNGDLGRVLSPVRAFLRAHADHHIVFFSDGDLWSRGDDELLDWLQLGLNARWTPRFFSETLGMRHWSEVEQYGRQHAETVEAQFFSIWLDEDERDRFRARFASLAQQPPGDR